MRVGRGFYRRRERSSNEVLVMGEGLSTRSLVALKFVILALLIAPSGCKTLYGIQSIVPSHCNKSEAQFCQPF